MLCAHSFSHGFALFTALLLSQREDPWADMMAMLHTIAKCNVGHNKFTGVKYLEKSYEAPGNLGGNSIGILGACLCIHNEKFYYLTFKFYYLYFKSVLL